jgi:hypothetical protein
MAPASAPRIPTEAREFMLRWCFPEHHDPSARSTAFPRSAESRQHVSISLPRGCHSSDASDVELLRKACSVANPEVTSRLPTFQLDRGAGIALDKAMATHAEPSISDTAILADLTWPDDDSLSPAAAHGWLAIRFEKKQLRRMHDLVTKNQDGKLSAKEKHELENYRRVSFLLDLMHSKARRSLKKRRPVP